MELLPKALHDRWELPLGGLRVTRCLVDYAFSFECWVASNDWSIVRIETPFEVITADSTKTIEPENTAELYPALQLFGAVVKTAYAFKNGSLQIDFSNGMSLVVPPHPLFEAWQVTLEGGAMVICTPGGRIATFGPRSSAERTSSLDM